MKLLIISGRSGSGKSTALNMLEDHGYYCIDNLPASLLQAFVSRICRDTPELPRVAVSIDARNIPEDLKNVPQILHELQLSALNIEIIFPLTSNTVGLREAIIQERELLEPISAMAGLSIDTSTMSVHQLREVVRSRILEKKDSSLSVMFESFGFKNGVPIDADFVFDARCLPNPYWDSQLRPLSGLDAPVADYLSNEPDVQALLQDIEAFLDRWLPRFEASNRSYMTVAIGCTGGQHRSVFLCEQLKLAFADKINNLQVLHRELRRRQDNTNAT